MLEDMCFSPLTLTLRAYHIYWHGLRARNKFFQFQLPCYYYVYVLHCCNHVCPIYAFPLHHIMWDAKNTQVIRKTWCKSWIKIDMNCVGYNFIINHGNQMVVFNLKNQSVIKKKYDLISIETSTSLLKCEYYMNEKL